MCVSVLFVMFEQFILFTFFVSYYIYNVIRQPLFFSFSLFFCSCSISVPVSTHRMEGDPHWYEPPWHKKTPVVRKANLKASELEDIMNDDSWTKAVFFRDPSRR